MSHSDSLFQVKALHGDFNRDFNRSVNWPIFVSFAYMLNKRIIQNVLQKIKITFILQNQIFLDKFLGTMIRLLHRMLISITSVTCC